MWSSFVALMQLWPMYLVMTLTLLKDGWKWSWDWFFFLQDLQPTCYPKSATCWTQSMRWSVRTWTSLSHTTLWLPHTIREYYCMPTAHVLTIFLVRSPQWVRWMLASKSRNVIVVLFFFAHAHHYFPSDRYLLEDQLKGPSSIEGYIRALKKGCRCVERELFCWPDFCVQWLVSNCSHPMIVPDGQTVGHACVFPYSGLLGWPQWWAHHLPWTYAHHQNLLQICDWGHQPACIYSLRVSQQSQALLL